MMVFKTCYNIQYTILKNWYQSVKPLNSEKLKSNSLTEERSQEIDIKLDWNQIDRKDRKRSHRFKRSQEIAKIARDRKKSQRLHRLQTC